MTATVIIQLLTVIKCYHLYTQTQDLTSAQILYLQSLIESQGEVIESQGEVIQWLQYHVEYHDLVNQRLKNSADEVKKQGGERNRNFKRLYENCCGNR